MRCTKEAKRYPNLLWVDALASFFVKCVKINSNLDNNTSSDISEEEWVEILQ